jgi:uncharacterized membrane protein
MNKNRLEAFSDGVIAIIITIMVLQLSIPAGNDLKSLKPLIPVLGSYVMSFLYVGIYWNNHHHMIHTVKHVSGGILWANLHLLFWLSLIPFVTRWIGASHFAATPSALYGVVLLMAAIAYFLLQTLILRRHGKDSLLARALGTDFKGKISPILYIIAILSTFIYEWISIGIYILVSLIWLIPDKRIERVFEEEHKKHSD